MESISEKLTHKFKAKAIMRKLTLDELEKVLEVVQETIEFKKVEAIEEMKREAAAQVAIDNAMAVLAKAGVDPRTVFGEGAKIPKKRKPKTDFNKQKLAVWDNQGYVRFWSGCGKMPVQFTQAMKFGYKKDELLKEAKVVLSQQFDDVSGCEKEALPKPVAVEKPKAKPKAKPKPKAKAKKKAA